MVPESFQPFFVGTAGTGGALIGLLFVAISIHPRRTFDPLAGAGIEDQRLAETTLLTLVNGFVVASIALIPGIDIGWGALPLGVGGVLAAARMSVRVASLHHHGASRSACWRHRLRTDLLCLVATVLYATQSLLGLHLLLQPTDASAFRWLAIILLGLYLVGIVHAWTLLGDPQSGWSGWLNPLQDLAAAGEFAEPQGTRPLQPRRPGPRDDAA